MTSFANFDNSYARLPDRFFARLNPTPVKLPCLIKVNTELASQLGLDADQLTSSAGLQILTGNELAPGSEPIATAYAGHQFGGFVPQLGDGRAILLGEVIDRSGARHDLQLKGAGPTPFSRRGDGRAALGPVLREYLVSEAMSALGVPTTRALAAVTTGEIVYRETPLPGAILTRVAASHIRVGSFEYFATRDDLDGVRILADYVISRHHPEAANAPQPYRALLERVIKAQAGLIPRWLHLGFIHGVMNTDNMAISGETIDYGPCAFMDEYDPLTVFSSIDRQGRYAYANQPAIAHWNLTRLAECLLPLLSAKTEQAIEMAEDALANFAPAFEQAFQAQLRAKLGLATALEQDVALGADLLKIMRDHRADFTLTFRQLSEAVADSLEEARLRETFAHSPVFDEWSARWRARLAQEKSEPEAVRDRMRAVNPAFIPRNHRVEAVIRAAEDHGNFAPFHELLEVLSRPYEDQQPFNHYSDPPQEHERVKATFCGT